MEPAAPGTEDEVLIIPALFRKKENQLSRLLSLKTRLPNGVFGHVFEHSIVNGSDHWYCNLCACPVMGRIYHHESGKRHTINMQNCGNIIEGSPDRDADPEPPLLVAPGEPVPPGFEENVQKVAQIQERLDNFTADALIGLEYLFELLEYDAEREPAYLCSLCDKRGDPRTIISHLASYHHVSQYLQRHFLKCYRALTPYFTKQYKRNWQNTMQKIAEAIETKFGRLKPHAVEKDMFDKKRSAYQTMVAKGPHFNERGGQTFEELVDKEELTKVIEDDPVITKQAEESVKRNYRKTGAEIGENTRHSPSPPFVAKPKKPKAALVATGERRRSLSSVSSISSSDLSDFDPGQSGISKKRTKSIEQSRKLENKDADTNKPPLKKQRNSPVRENKRYEPRSNHRNNSPIRDRSNNKFDKGHEVLPWQRSDYRSRNENPVPDRPKAKVDKHSEFKKLSLAIEKDMDRVLKQHEKHPEKHSQYNEEWKKFWNLRYKELQAEGKNPAGHDFKPEWIEYWNKKLKELHAIEVKNKKDALRKRLGIRDEPAQICFTITGKKKPVQKDDDSKLAPMASAPDHDPDVIIIDEQETSQEAKFSRRSRSPWESESNWAKHRSRSKGRRFSRSSSRSRSRNRRSRSRGSPARISRNRRSHSREREMEWSNRDQYREYSREYLRDQKMYYSEYPPEYIKPPRIMRDVTRHPVNSPPRTMHPVSQEPDLESENIEVNVVGVLRLLTALEEKLGSLGPKVIDLLSQALAMEKSEANSSEALLDNEINCVMFETVKEKLKGQLLAGLVSYAQEKAFKVAIKKIASLIHLASERKKERENKKPKMDPIQVPGVGTVDKAAIAKQIASALIVQGKTDVTQVELEQLINAVVGMAEASQNSKKPMTTASFLNQLTQRKQPALIEKEMPMVTLKTVLQPPTESFLPPPTYMEGLSDSDLQTLLQNFKDLCTEEQHSLISYLKKLEAREPERVERLRKFVNLDVPSAIPERDTDALFEKSDDEANGQRSPFASRFEGTNPTSDDNLRNKFDNSDKPKIIDRVTIDSDEDDYTYEDVFKAANKNVLDKEEKDEQERQIAKSTAATERQDLDLSSAKSIIANIIGQFKSKAEVVPSVSNPTIPAVVPPPQPPSVPLPPNFPSFLEKLPINLANLASALNTVQQIKSNPSHPPSLLNKPQFPGQPKLQQQASMPPQLNPIAFPPQRSQINQTNPNPNNFASQSRSLQNVQHLQQNTPHSQQNIPHTQQNVPPPRQNVPHAQQNVPHPQQNVPRPQQNVLHPQQNVPRSQQNIPHLQQNLPYLQQHLPHPQRQSFTGSQPQFQPPDPHFEPPVPRFEPPSPSHQSHFPSLFGNKSFRADFNRPLQPPNNFARRPEYFDDYENRW